MQNPMVLLALDESIIKYFVLVHNSYKSILWPHFYIMASCRASYSCSSEYIYWAYGNVYLYMHQIGNKEYVSCLAKYHSTAIILWWQFIHFKYYIQDMDCIKSHREYKAPSHTKE